MSPQIITVIESLYKIMGLCCKEYILTHHRTLSMESYPSYCHSGLSKGTISTKTNKHNHFKQTEAEPPETLNENRKSIKQFRILL